MGSDGHNLWAGVLVECDPSIKSIILSFDAANHDFVIEDLDEGRLVVKENMVQVLRQRLDEVRKFPSPLASFHYLSLTSQRLG